MARRKKADRAEVIGRICAKVATGMLVKDACKLEKTTRQTLHEWLKDEPALADLYARAREEQAHAIAEEAMTIADEAADSSEEVQRNKLRVDTRKWLASKIAPRNYGERLELAGDKNAPLNVKVTFAHE